MSSQNEISGNIATNQIYTSAHNLDNDDSDPTLKQSMSTGSETPEQQHGENDKPSTTIEATEQQYAKNGELTTIENRNANDIPQAPVSQWSTLARMNQEVVSLRTCLRPKLPAHRKTAPSKHQHRTTRPSRSMLLHLLCQQHERALCFRLQDNTQAAALNSTNSNVSCRRSATRPQSARNSCCSFLHSSLPRNANCSTRCTQQTAKGMLLTVNKSTRCSKIVVRIAG